MANNIMQVLLLLALQLLFTFGLHYAWVLMDSSTNQDGLVKSKKDKHVAILILFAMYFIYIIFSVSRSVAKGFGGEDAFYYWDYYRQADCSFSEFSEICTMELGFRLLLWVFRRLGISFRVLLFLIHSFVFSAVVIFSRHCRKRNHGLIGHLATFLLCGELFIALCVVRNEVALALSLIFFILLEKKKYWLALIPMLLALSIHLSSLILFAVYAVLLVLNFLKAKGRKSVFLLIGICTVLEFAVIPIINMIIRNTKYAYYIGNGGIALGTYAILFVATLAIFMDKNCDMINTTHARYLMVGWLCLPLQLFYGIFYRTLLFFMPVLFMLLPEVWRSLGDFPVRIDLQRRKLILQEGLIPHITRKNFMDYRIYLPLLRAGLKVLVVFYMFSRGIKMFTNDYVQYGLYHYFPFFMN